MHPEFKRIYAKALQKLSNPSKAKDAKALFLELTQMSTSNADVIIIIILLLLFFFNIFNFFFF